ncbi:Arsenate reductase (glutaredoxin) [Saliniradius amylolyticus]|uniref:Arsenate reductase n=1 Tax=Saliniradius amylolyticus TaxID=2183582 RepID=A0A2S2E2W4_9ALTE|nr:arsenate reductase (glutaredoxin) [Saliniradius amylolyticus]AWL11862.1 Arsenate reductase (glutaredoxin) [Saliniradius amylolyticus]
MSQVQILHNPRCSKSRQTLQLLKDKGVEPEIVEYLKTPLDRQALATLQQQLGLDDARQMMRTKEAEYKAHNLGDTSLTNEQLLAAIADTPKLLERPIVINQDKARIGRPPENVLDVL